MKIAVILENAPDCELDRTEIEVANNEAVDDAVSKVIDAWILSVGDTIRIVEVP